MAEGKGGENSLQIYRESRLNHFYLTFIKLAALRWQDTTSLAHARIHVEADIKIMQKKIPISKVDWWETVTCQP